MPSVTRFCTQSSLVQGLRASEKIVGTKAAGLLLLPNTWVPEFFVITTRVYRDVLTNVGCSDSSKIATYLAKSDRKGIMQSIASINLTQGNRLILRSSSTDESMTNRGRYMSKICVHDPDEVIRILSQLYRTWYKKRLRDEELFAVVVQRYVKSHAKGHLSNERRITHLLRDWKIEHEPITSNRLPQIHTFKVFRHRIPDHRLPDRISCRSHSEINPQLQYAARKATFEKQRVHYEWVWDGQNIWIVQADTDPRIAGENPRQAFEFPIEEFQPIKFRILREIDSDDCYKWPKAENVVKLRSAGLQTANLWTLSNKQEIVGLAAGIVSDDLKYDIDRLTVLPLVVRTDLDRSVDQLSRQMLPRTNNLSDFEEVLEFLKTTAKGLQQSLVLNGKVCFLFHHFIPSTSSAYCFANPKDSRVRIDSIWGLPDGLSFYSHDSSELDLSRPESLIQRRRFKGIYLGVRRDGKWIEKSTGEPWDWHISIGSRDVQDIAKKTKQFADFIDSPVRLMWFVDVPSSIDYPKNIPWYYELQAAPEGVITPVFPIGLTSKDLVVRNLDDIRTGFRQLKKRGHLPRLVLMPTPDFIRNEDYVREAARLAKDARMPIILYGSILQHAYYQLVAHGANVCCVEPLRSESEDYHFHKLVRDKIPEQIERHGEIPTVQVLSGDELEDKLKAKISEEAFEVFWANNTKELTEELADLQETISALMRHVRIDPDRVRELQEKKRREKGGFEKGTVLVETTQPPLINVANEGMTRKRGGRPKDTDVSGKTKIRIAPIPSVSRDGILYSLEQIGISLFVKYEPDSISIEVRGPSSGAKKVVAHSYQLTLPFPESTN